MWPYGLMLCLTGLYLQLDWPWVKLLCTLAPAVMLSPGTVQHSLMRINATLTHSSLFGGQCPSPEWSLTAGSYSLAGYVSCPSYVSLMFLLLLLSLTNCHAYGSRDDLSLLPGSQMLWALECLCVPATSTTAITHIWQFLDVNLCISDPGWRISGW